jgi:hypothetical protein
MQNTPKPAANPAGALPPHAFATLKPFTSIAAITEWWKKTTKAQGLKTACTVLLDFREYGLGVQPREISLTANAWVIGFTSHTTTRFLIERTIPNA